MKIKLTCEDKYESQKLSSLIFIKDSDETYIEKIINIFDNEVVLEIKDKSAHSVLLKDKYQVEIFVDFIQSVVDKEHRIIATTIFEEDIEIVKGWVLMKTRLKWVSIRDFQSLIKFIVYFKPNAA